MCKTKPQCAPQVVQATTMDCDHAKAPGYADLPQQPIAQVTQIPALVCGDTQLPEHALPLEPCMQGSLTSMIYGSAQASAAILPQPMLLIGEEGAFSSGAAQVPGFWPTSKVYGDTAAWYIVAVPIDGLCCQPIVSGSGFGGMLEQPCELATWQGSALASGLSLAHLDCVEFVESPGLDGVDAMHTPCQQVESPGFQPEWGRARSDSAAGILKNSEFDRDVVMLKESGAVRRLSFEKVGCRTVQNALERVDRQTATEFASDLRGKVSAAIRHPHANYVIQKIIGVLTSREVPFIADEAMRMGPELAKHEYGCRVCCRLLEQDARDERTQLLVDNLLWDAGGLAQHVFGHHVIESVLEHGLEHQQRWIITALRQDLWQRQDVLNYSSYAIDKALIHGNQQDREGLVWDLLALPLEQIVGIASCQFRSALFRTLLQMSEVAAEKLAQCVLAPSGRARLSGSKFGRRLCEDFGVSLASHAARDGSRR